MYAGVNLNYISIRITELLLILIPLYAKAPKMQELWNHLHISTSYLTIDGMQLYHYSCMLFTDKCNICDKQRCC